jgi:hypothetical protein
MIARRIDHEAGSDNYRALALYIAGAGHGEEKVLASWTAGCLEDDDYLESIREVEAVQALNTRAVKGKTYHLVVSFRPEDEDKLTPEIFKDMEQTFAAALGFAGHQRHCGAHRNTDNLHLHLACNMVAPGTFKKIEPFRDFKKLSEVCRQLEKKYGLTVDRGAEPEHSSDAPAPNPKVKAIEARSGKESLFTYIMRHKPDIMADLAKAADWSEVQAAFLSRGLQLKAAGNGLAIRDRRGKSSAKASGIDRALSKARLEARFGLFEAPTDDLLLSIKAAQSYTAAPIQVNPERDGLYQSFLEEIAARRSALGEINQEGARLYEANRSKWAQKRLEIRRLPMLNHDRRRVRLAMKKRERDELAAVRAEVAAKRNAVREERPYSSWNAYLQHLASQGLETALAILRSRKEEIQPESTPEPPAGPQEAGQAWEAQRMEILKTPGISGRHRNALLAVVKMRELLEGDPGQPPSSFTFRIDTKGTVIFTLPGGTIRDTGREVHCGAGNERVRELAAKLAQSRHPRVVQAGAENDNRSRVTSEEKIDNSR